MKHISKIICAAEQISINFDNSRLFYTQVNIGKRKHIVPIKISEQKTREAIGIGAQPQALIDEILVKGKEIIEKRINCGESIKKIAASGIFIQ